MKIRKPAIMALIIVFLIVLVAGAALAQVRAKVRGLVVDSQGNPVDKATISIISVRSASQRYETRTGKDGRFAQIGIYPGYYQLIAKKDGFITKTLEIHVAIDSDTELEIKLDSADELAAKTLSGADKAFLRATELYNKQNYSEALSGFLEAINLNPDNWAYYFNLGLTYKKLKNMAEAREAFRQAVERNPESYSANKEMGETLALEGQFDKAAGFYQKAIAINPNDPDGHYNLGVCLVNLGQSEEALCHFQKTIELQPDYAEAYFQLGSIYISQNKKNEAITSLEKFLQLAPQHEKAALARQLLEYLKK